MDWGMLVWTIIITGVVVAVIVSTIKDKKIENIEREFHNYRKQYDDQQKALKAEKIHIEKDKTEVEKLKQEYESKQAYLNKVLSDFQGIIDQNFGFYPKLAAIMADLETYYYERSAKYLCQKDHPAFAEAQRIRDFREESKQHIKQRKLAEYRLSYITTIYPQLRNIFDSDFDEKNPPPLIEADRDVIISYAKHYDEFQYLIRILNYPHLFDVYFDFFISREQASAYQQSLETERLIKANNYSFDFDTPIEINAVVKSQTGDQKYHTSLQNCTCPDYIRHGKPCKHMLALAIRVYAFSCHEEIMQNALQSISSKIEYLEQIQKSVSKDRKITEEIKKVTEEKQQTYPYLAKLIADNKIQCLDVAIRDHVTKKELTSKIHAVEKENAMLKNQLAVFEYVFPILNEFKDVAPQNLSHAIENAQGTGFQYQWLSPEEYATLTSEEKQQKWIERYLNSPSRSNWEAGIKYERYIGYLCEKEGYTVKYTGATLKLNDMGRDLIVTRKSEVFVVQCKRYSQSKEVHENHLFQLFGSVAHYKKEHPNQEVVGVFVTSSRLSDVARECAQSLSVTVYENIPFQSYPTIKCNIGRDGEKIYHLPFDQQYDNITISASRDELYVETVAEAQFLGFRHAMRYKFTQ